MTTNSTEQRSSEKLKLNFMPGIKVQHFQDVIRDAHITIDKRKKGELLGFVTKWKAINNQLGGGLYFGTNLVIGARPGIGKTALANELILNIAILNKNIPHIILYFNMEMTNNRQGIRFLSRKTGSSVLDLLSENQLTLKELDDIEDLKNKSKDLNIFFIDTPVTPTLFKQINESVFNQYPQHRIVNVIDHTRLIRKEDDFKTEEEKITRLMEEGNFVKKQLETVNIYLSQLNRNIENEDRRKNYFKPMLSDLFGADSVGQFADVVWLLHRPERYNIQSINIDGNIINTKDVLFIENEKSRDGYTGTILLQHNLAINKIVDYNFNK